MTRVTNASLDEARSEDHPADAWESCGRMGKAECVYLADPIPLASIPIELRKGSSTGSSFGVSVKVQQGRLFGLRPKFGEADTAPVGTPPPNNLKTLPKCNKYTLAIL